MGEFFSTEDTYLFCSKCDKNSVCITHRYKFDVKTHFCSVCKDDTQWVACTEEKAFRIVKENGKSGIEQLYL